MRETHYAPSSTRTNMAIGAAQNVNVRIATAMSSKECFFISTSRVGCNGLREHFAAGLLQL